VCLGQDDKLFFCLNEFKTTLEGQFALNSRIMILSFMDVSLNNLLKCFMNWLNCACAWKGP